MQQREEYREEHRVVNLPRAEEKDKSYHLAERIIYYALGIIEAVLGIRVLLKALGANPTSPFVQFVDALSSPFAAPFRDIFSSSSAGIGSVFEWSIAFGMVVYVLVALGLVKLFRLIIKGGSRSVDDAA